MTDAFSRRARLTRTPDGEAVAAAETHALLLRRLGHPTALTFVRTVDESPNVVGRSTRELEQAAERDRLARYADHDFSFIDVVSFAVMTERRIRDALGLDHRFAAAGFSLVGEPATG